MAAIIKIILILLILLNIKNSGVESITFLTRNDLNLMEKADNFERSPYELADKIEARNNQAKNGQFPWMAAIHSLYLDKVWAYRVCGGSILSVRWVLTAGHCVKNINEFLVIFGDVDRRNSGYRTYDGPGVAMLATDSVIHPDYQINVNDIALLYMPEDIPFGPTIQPIRLAGRNEVHKSYAGRRALVLGWGGDGISQTRRDSLQFGFLPIISHEKCFLDWDLPESVVCTAANTGVDACKGDSGSPLVIDSNRYHQYLQIGIVSSGYDVECPSSRPGLYTRVDYFNEWIYFVTGIQY
ncbi:complement factor D [Microplitis demolitor]|uniref:complement factor D n=1 Tax=Microplitis demolitor TaxID=69319 RepID=UPI0004CCA204|nr:complement factor D [Microplitis demolitor]